MPAREEEEAIAIRTAEVDASAFQRSIGKLAKIWSAKVLAGKTTLLAFSIIADAQNAPVPRDKGLLSESATVQRGEREGEIAFGFNRAYAAIQDLGGENLPPKRYGSDLGPNFYFSQTVKRRGPLVLQAMAKLMAEDLRQLSVKEKKLTGKTFKRSRRVGLEPI